MQTETTAPSTWAQSLQCPCHARRIKDEGSCKLLLQIMGVQHGTENKHDLEIHVRKTHLEIRVCDSIGGVSKTGTENLVIKEIVYALVTTKL